MLQYRLHVQVNVAAVTQTVIVEHNGTQTAARLSMLSFCPIDLPFDLVLPSYAGGCGSRHTDSHRGA